MTEKISGGSSTQSAKSRKIIKFSLIGIAVLLVLACVIAIPVAITQSKKSSKNRSSSNARDLSPAVDSCGWTDFYLPRGVAAPVSQDIHVNLTMRPPYVVQGTTRMMVDLLASTRCVVMNSADMNVTSVMASYGGEQQKGNAKMNPDNQTLTLVFDSPLPEGSVSFDLAFVYILEAGLTGFYRSSYEEDGETKELAVTTMETIYARKAFPCFDEPIFKANFSVAVTVPDNYTVLNNMPLVNKSRDVKGMTTWKFAPTPKMSSYLVAWAVGVFASQKGTCKTMAGDLPVGVWGTPPRAALLKAAVNMTCASVIESEKLFNVPFPLPKLDLLGVPDFAAGAMENWGLITYIESSLLVNPKTDSRITESNVALTVAHEVTHHWFGDLVTCNNWTELWLNEGFASYFEFLGANAYNPELSQFDTFYTAISIAALHSDAAPSSHPLSVDARLEQLSDADNFFDNIMYEKGGSVLRMLRVWLNHEKVDTLPVRALMAAGPDETTRLVGGRRQLVADGTMGTDVSEKSDLFLKGLNTYLKEYAYNTTGYQELWTAVGKGAVMEGMPGMEAPPILDWMRTWTLRRGFPLLTLESSADGGVTVKQTPFSVGEGEREECDAGEELGSWWIPLAYMVQGETTVHWTSFNSCSVTLPVQASSNAPTPYVLLNAGRFGYFKVNYPDAMWSALSEAAADARTISEVDYAALMEDSNSLAEQGTLDVTVFLELTKNLGKRLTATEFAPWIISGNVFSKMSQLLGGATEIDSKKCFADMAKYITTKLTGPVLKGFQPSPLTKPVGLSFNVSASETLKLRLMRQAVLNMAGAYGDAALGGTALTLLESVQKGNGVIHADVQVQAYNLAIASNDPKAFDFILSMYKKATDADEKDRLQSALSSGNTPDIISKSLDLITTGAIPTARLGRFASQVGGHSGLSFNMTWEFLFKNFDTLVERNGDNAAYALGGVTSDLASLFADDSQLPRLEAFAKKYSKVLPGSFLEATKDSIEQNIAWVKANGKPACSWFAKNAAAA